MIELNTIETIASVILHGGGIIIGLLLILGYFFHVGRDAGGELKLRKVSQHEYRVVLSVIGGITLLYFIILALISYAFAYFELPKENLRTLEGILFISILISYFYYGLGIFESRNWKKISLLLTVYILILIFYYLFKSVLFLQIIAVVVVFGLMLLDAYKKGLKYGEKEFTDEVEFVDVFTDYGEEKNLILYQTTDIDYRFKSKDGEIIIPKERVKKIVYTCNEGSKSS